MTIARGGKNSAGKKDNVFWIQVIALVAVIAVSAMIFYSAHVVRTEFRECLARLAGLDNDLMLLDTELERLRQSALTSRESITDIEKSAALLRAYLGGQWAKVRVK